MFSRTMIEQAHQTLGLPTNDEAIQQKREELYDLVDERQSILNYELTADFLKKISPRTTIEGEERLALATRIRNRAINEAIEELLNEPVRAVEENRLQQETEQLEQELLQ